MYTKYGGGERYVSDYLDRRGRSQLSLGSAARPGTIQFHGTKPDCAKPKHAIKINFKTLKLKLCLPNGMA